MGFSISYIYHGVGFNVSVLFKTWRSPSVSYIWSSVGSRTITLNSEDLFWFICSTFFFKKLWFSQYLTFMCACVSYFLSRIYCLHALITFELAFYYYGEQMLFIFPMFFFFPRYALCSCTNTSNKCQYQDLNSFDAD